MNHITLLAGGTGGHVFPALVLAEALRASYKVTFLTDPRSQGYCQSVPHLNYTFLPLKRRGQRLLDQGIWLASLFKSFIISLWFFIKERPNLVIGFGGYPSIPGGLAAILLRIPFIIHEQNAVLGRTNRLLGHFAQKLALTFAVTQKIPSALKNKTCYTGLPIRSRKNQPESFPGFTLVVLGGSQGAQFVSQQVTECVRQLPETFLENLRLYQQCPSSILDSTKKCYQALKGTYHVAEFFPNMVDLLHQADFVIGRAGAATLAELAHTAKPALLIPYPYAKDDHQTINAQYFVAEEAALMIPEAMLTAPKITEILCKFAQAPALGREMGQRAQALQPADSLAMLLALIKKIQR